MREFLKTTTKKYQETKKEIYRTSWNMYVPVVYETYILHKIFFVCEY
jgi:hypothetical protein